MNYGDAVGLVQPQIRDALEMPVIARQQDQRMLEGCGCNEQIEIRDEIALPAKRRTKPSKVLHGVIGERENGEERQILPERGNVYVRLGVVVGAFIHFAKRDDTDTQSLVAMLLEERQRL